MLVLGCLRSCLTQQTGLYSKHSFSLSLTVQQMNAEQLQANWDPREWRVGEKEVTKVSLPAWPNAASQTMGFMRVLVTLHNRIQLRKGQLNDS